MFTFANPWLLWAFPILVLPWIFRRRQQEKIKHVPFPLLEFLRESEQRDLIDPQVQEFLLLLLRTLLLALLILALAGPRWTNQNVSGWFPGLPFASAASSYQVVIDHSYSMGYQDEQQPWWPRAQQVWEEVATGFSGWGVQSIQWNQATLSQPGGGGAALVSQAEAERLFLEAPQEPGTPFLELWQSTETIREPNQPFLVITDGQRWPWQSLLDNPQVEADFSNVVVIPVGGTSSPMNRWVELEALSSAPWGLAGWESLAGRLGIMGAQEPQQGSLAITAPETGRQLLNRPYSFAPTQGEATYSPFSYTTSFADLAQAVQLEQEAPDIQLEISASPSDALPVDDQIVLELPIAAPFNFIIMTEEDAASRAQNILRSMISVWQRGENTPLRIAEVPPGSGIPAQSNLLMAAPSLAPSWTAADSNALLEYVRQGGNAILFTGGDDLQGPWSDLLQGLDWIWIQTEASFEEGSLSVSGQGPLAEALRLWEEDIWQPWLPAGTGEMNAEESRRWVSYRVGDQLASLLTERRLGQGRLYLVNSALDQEQQVLLSPLFPVLTWELAKRSVRTQQEIESPAAQSRPESDLTLLSEADRQTLTERFGIQFAPPENPEVALSEQNSGSDLRLLFLGLCLMIALAESWLANRLASM